MNVDNRRGELAELKSQLRQLAGSRAPGAEELKRELYKKVISYMTVGVDVSSLFSEMIISASNADIVLKKMCYLYLGNYAVVNPELALLTINFLQKDCKDENPMIRGLALRSLCSLRVHNLVEYFIGPITTGLEDKNPYVRTVAAMGVLKLFHLSPASVKDNDFINTLKVLMIQDPDPQVVASSLCSLQEILTDLASTDEFAAKEKESLTSKPIIYGLLNRIKEFSEWAQCLVLELAAKYIPADSNETFDIMNLLEDRLVHANSAVVLATCKVFLHLTMSMANVHQQVYERIKSPLVTLITTGTSELAYAVLSHLHMLVMRAPVLFGGDYKFFYCRYSDPSYVKKLKLEILTAIANESNTYEIVTELSEYAANVDVPIARESIRAVGRIALRRYDVNGIVDRLLQFLEMDTDYVTAETLVLVKDLLRKYPAWSQDCIAVVGGVSSKGVSEPRAKAALIWILGEFGQDMTDAPYVLESLVESWSEEASPEVRLEMLTASMKLFFKRPPQCQSMLGVALKAGIQDPHQDVHDRALLYYRLLQQGVELAERVVNPVKQAVTDFAESQSSEMKDRIFDEFNTLAVVYQKPSYMFLNKDLVSGAEAEPLALEPSSPNDVLLHQSELSDTDMLLSASEKEDTRAGSISNGSDAYSAPEISAIDIPAHAHSSIVVNTIANTSPHRLSVTSQQETSLLPGLEVALPSMPAPTTPSMPSPSFPLDDLFSGMSVPETMVTSAPPPPPQLVLSPRPVLDAQSFQRKWSQLSVALTMEERIAPTGLLKLATPQPLSVHMVDRQIFCMASGGKTPNFKYYFYAQNQPNLLDPSPQTVFFLVELQVDTTRATALGKVKADDPSLAPAFANLFRVALARFGLL